MRTLEFYKESDGRWYVDLPEWEGEKADLEMVAGADSMLEYMAEGEGRVKVLMSTDRFDGADRLKFLREADEVNNGAYYALDSYRGVDINLNMWLCDVTKFVFGGFPKSIHIQRVG